jgi:hypothetical protein
MAKQLIRGCVPKGITLQNEGMACVALFSTWLESVLAGLLTWPVERFE